MKTYLSLLLSFLFTNMLNAQELQLPFYDDFSNDYENWTSYSVSGDEQWHLSGDDGIDGSKCARFYITTNPSQANDDWLVSKVFNTEGASNLAIEFKFWYHGDGMKPEFYYANSFTGDVSATDWTELDNSFWKNEWTWIGARIEIENPGDTFVFAIRYQSTTENSEYVLIDNFSIKEFEPVIYEKVGTSEHFEFYTSLSTENDYSEIKSGLETEYSKLADLWNRPGINPVFPTDLKIKVYYSSREDINQIEASTPNWKCGFHNNSLKEVYLAPLENQQQTNFYGDFKKLAVNEFSQLAISCKFLRENNSYFPPYFLEGFGLYEAGFRPNRDDVIQYVSDGLAYDYITDTSDIATNTIKKSLTIANIEGQVLTPWSYLGVNPGASSFINSQWQNFLKHFYTKSESDRIKLQYSSEHFNFYSADSDSPHMTEVYSYFENACSYYIENYKLQPEHRYNVVFCQDDQIGADITGWGPLPGGAGCGGDLVIELSPNFNFNQTSFYSDYFGFAGMCAHEFFHVFYNHFMWEIPGGFWAEGSADFSQRHSLNWPIPKHSLWKITELFTDYKDKYNVNINLEHISNNPNGELDIYFFGDMFFEFIYQNHGGFENIKKFFNQGMDYSVFGASYEEIDSGYISFLKSLAGITTKTDIVKNESKNNLEFLNDPITNNSSISFNIQKTGKVNLSVYDIQGRKISTLINEKLNAGKHIIPVSNALPASGVYFCKLQTPEGITSKKLIVFTK